MPAIKRKTLTITSLDSAKPGARPYRLWDAKSPGLALRVLPSGLKTFEMHLRRGMSEKLGRYPTMTLECARMQAQAAVAHFVSHGGSRRKKVASKAETFGDFLRHAYGPWLTEERKAGAATIANLKAQFADYLCKPLTAFSAFGLERFKADRLEDGISPATVNRDLARLSGCLTKAVEWKMLAEHPVRGVKPAKGGDEHRVRYLDVDEEKALRKALDEREKHTARALERKVLTVRAAAAKSSKARHVSLNSEAVDVLKRYRKQHTEGRLFAVESVKKSWAALMAKAKLRDFHFHDLRHTFASKLVMAPCASCSDMQTFG